MIDWMFKNKIMPEKIPEGLIVFIPKKGKDKTQIKNLRPLTLLNTVYKIASGVMAERIKIALPTIISKDQYGFMAGRQAADLIELTRQIIEDAKKKEKNLAIFALDFSGAFDNISYKSIIDSMYRRGFGKNFATNIAVLLSKNSSKIVINGRFKGSINIEKSCRQGDPISPYLFILVLDQLLDQLNHTKSLKGYEMKKQKKTVKVTAAAFADDCYAFLTGKEESIKKQFETVKRILKKFEKDTGLKINVLKSELTTSGPLATSLVDEKGEKRNLKVDEIENNGNIRMLGVNIGLDSNIKNDVIKTLDRSITFWKKFQYNEVDKIELINAFVIPSVIHILRHIPFERAFENKMNKMITDFMWMNKRRYISKDIIFQKTKNGGMGALAVGKVWIKVLMSWFERTLSAVPGTPILELAKDEYKKEYGHNPSSLFVHGIVSEKRIRKEDSVLKSAFRLQRWCWSKFLDGEDFENQPLIENPRILKDKVTAQIKKENLPAFDEATIPTTLWLREEIDKINR